VRGLEKNAGAVAGIVFAAAGATMVEVDEDLERLTDDVMRFAALNVNQETNAAGVMFELWVVEALFPRCNGPRPGASSPLLCLDAHRVIRDGDVITFRPAFELKFLYFLRSHVADAMFVFGGNGWSGFIRKAGRKETTNKHEATRMELGFNIAGNGSFAYAGKRFGFRAMGLDDRDYMRRASKEAEEASSSVDEKLEAFFSGFLGRHPRFLVVAGVVVAVVILLAIVIAKMGGKGN